MKRLLFAAASLAVFGCAEKPPTDPDVDVSFARGPRPPAEVIITPTRLDTKQLGCKSSRAEAINDMPLAAAVGACSRNGQLNLFLWRESSGASVISQEGIIRDVSNSGGLYGISNFVPFVKPAGGSITYLPLLPGNSMGDVYGVAANDSRIAGMSEFFDGTTNSQTSVIWTNIAGSWSVAEFPGYPTALTSDGNMIVGGNGGHAATWRSVSGTWTMQTLPDGGAVTSTANAVNQTGTVIAGVRYIPLQSDPSQTYDEHVAWISDGAGGWTMKILGGFNIREGIAYGVADQVDGSTLVVGESWQDKDGPGSQLWAVAWKKPAGSSEFDSPVRLQPLTKGVPAAATDVNSMGQIVGSSYTGSSVFAVIWQFR